MLQPRQKYDASRGNSTGCSFLPRFRRFLTATLPWYIVGYAKSAHPPTTIYPAQIPDASLGLNL